MAYTKEVGDAICERLASGWSLRKSAEEAGIHPSTVLDWCERHPEFAQQYAGARARGYQLLADEILEISDESRDDIIETETGPVTNHEVIARSRLRVDSRKWMLSKMLPKVYGDKITAEHTGPNGAPLFDKMVVEVVKPGG